MRHKRRLPIQRIAVAMLALSVLASGVYFARQSGTNPEAYGNDFSVYYHAAREVVAGRDPYQHSLGDWTPYIYPALLAELIVPLALLPLTAAAYIWFLISAASIAGAAWMSASLATDKRRAGALEQRGTESDSWRAAVACCAVVVVLRFVLDTFNLGQVNAVVAALAVAHVYLYSRDRKALSALALVLAVSIKLTPVLLLLYHASKLRLKFVVACATLLVAVTAVSFLPFGSRGADAFQTFVSRTLKNEQGYDFAYSGNQSLRGAIARLAYPVKQASSKEEGEVRRPIDATTLLISIVLLALAGFAAVRAENEMAAAAPFFCCQVLLSPLSWKAHYVILIPPIAHLLSLVKTLRGVRFSIAATLGIAFVLFNLTSPRVIGLAAAEWADDHSSVVAGALLIFVACVASVQLRNKR